MKLAISNIAWLPEEAQSAYRLMEKWGARGLEIAPSLAFSGESDPFAPPKETVQAFKSELAAHNISLVSMQSLLYGAVDTQLFGEIDARARFETAIKRAIQLAETLEIGNLVFGSPSNRSYPTTMSKDEAENLALETIMPLADFALKAGTTLAIEPNPAAYGTNFLTTVADAAHFVGKANHPAIGLNFDIGALLMNDENDVDALIASSGGRVAHVHFSEPQLAPAPMHMDRASEVVDATKRAGYDRWFSIEMKRSTENCLTVIDAALSRASNLMSAASNNRKFSRA